MTQARSTLPALLLAGTAGLALAGCKIDDRPLLARGEPAPMALAGLPEPYQGQLVDLPPAPPVPISYLEADQAYLYPERAYRFERAAYRQAPDYAFAYDDERPWAWARDDGMMFAEPYDDGYRFYYYEPDEPYPYFVRDDRYGYAYGDNGVLLALFDAAGALLAPNLYPQFAPAAGRYWVHAQDLNRTYWAAPRYPVEEALWAATAPRLYAAQDPWLRAAETVEPWRALRTRHDNGLHLGWYKDKGRPAPVALSAPPMGPVRAAPGPDRTWRSADRPDERGRDRRAREDRGGEDRGHGERQFARAASDAGRNASARGPERPSQARGGEIRRPDKGPERRMNVADNRPQPSHGGPPSEHKDHGQAQAQHQGGGDKGGQKGAGHGGDGGQKGGHGGGKGK